MASLFIKDSETADRVRRMAKRLGSTQTEIVRRGLEALERELPSQEGDEPKRDLLAWLDEHRRLNPLPPKIGEADKAFFDRLWGEPD
jgi:antitoxin VapB